MAQTLTAPGKRQSLVVWKYDMCFSLRIEMHLQCIVSRLHMFDKQAISRHALLITGESGAGKTEAFGASIHTTDCHTVH